MCLSYQHAYKAQPYTIYFETYLNIKTANIKLNLDQVDNELPKRKRVLG